MFVTKINQILGVLPPHWESEARKGVNPDAKVLACALMAERQAHSTGKPVIALRLECMESFGLHRYAVVERGAHVLERAAPERIAEVFSGAVSLNEALSAPKYTVTIQKPTLVEGDSGMDYVSAGSAITSAKRGREPYEYSSKLFYFGDGYGFYTRGALKLANDLLKLTENPSMSQDITLKVYKYIEKLVKDVRYRRGGLITIEELASAPEIYPDRVPSGKAGQDESLRRLDKVKCLLATVCDVFNKMEGREESAFALIPEYGVTKSNSRKLIGVCVPATHEAYENAKQPSMFMQNVYSDRIATQEAAQRRQIAAGQLPELGAGDDDEPEKANGAAAGFNNTPKK
jgi:hypothetical protein